MDIGEGLCDLRRIPADHPTAFGEGQVQRVDSLRNKRT